MRWGAAMGSGRGGAQRRVRFGAGPDGTALTRIHRFTLIDGGLPNEQMPSYLGR